MCHIQTSIVSRHLATRGNNKILRIPPPHTSSSEERLPLLTGRTLAQLKTIKSLFLKSCLHKVDATMPPSVTSTHTTHNISSTAPHIRTTLSPLDLWTDPAGGDCTAGPDGWRSWLVDHKREHRTPPH